jgi:hypothetical protein
MMVSEVISIPEDIMASQPERVAVLEEKVRGLEGLKPPGWKIFSTVVGAAVLWLSFISIQLYLIAQRVSHMEGKIGDPLAATVKGLESPVSDATLAADLQLLSAQIRVDEVRKAQAKPENVQMLASALTEVTKKHPELPETWQAAAQLVNYKYQAQDKSVSELSNCLGGNGERYKYSSKFSANAVPSAGNAEQAQIPLDSLLPGVMPAFVLTIRDCALNLDDDGNFPSTLLGRAVEEARKSAPELSAYSLVLNMFNVHVTYTGGKLIPVKGILFRDCTFEFKSRLGIPSKGSQQITSQLLVASASEGKLTVSDGM